MSSFAKLRIGAVPDMTSYFSLAYLLLFLPICLIVYSAVPQKAKKYVLLVSSYVFFYLISGELLAYLLLITLSMHYFGLWLDRVRGQMEIKIKSVDKDQKKIVKAEFQHRSRLIIAFAVVLQIGGLLSFKYTGFFASNINSLLSLFNSKVLIDVPKIIMPIGISFFTLQAVSYLIDVYRGTVKADENLLRLALFIGFFPQIVEGPICRYSQTAEQLWNVKGISYQNLTFGIQRILFGLMKKIVVADRLNMLIKNVFDQYDQYDGAIIALAAVCYTIQLYMDFSGTMDAVIGTAQIFDVGLPENFERPFFSKTISEFWKRWHITLGTWFRDYLFYPVTMLKKMKSITSSARKKIGNHYGPLIAGSAALFAVWFCNGLWHGADWNFLFFGMYHFALILTGNMIEPLVNRFNALFHIRPEHWLYRALQIIRTVVLVIIGEMFFRANGLAAGLAMFKRMVTDFHFSALNSIVIGKLGIDSLDFIIVGVTIILILAVSILNERKVSVRNCIAKRNIAVRYAIWYLLILYIVIFGAYGEGYVPVDPIYSNF